MNDIMEVEFSIDDGLTWMNLETVGPTGSEVSGGWFNKEFDLTAVAGFVPTNQFQVRFLASDLSDGSVIEAGVDGLLLSGPTVIPPNASLICPVMALLMLLICFRLSRLGAPALVRAMQI